MPEEKIYYTDTLEQLRRFDSIRKDAEQRKKVEDLQQTLPQGHNSGLDADMVDRHHYEDIMNEVDEKISRIPRHGVVGGGGGSTLLYGTGVPDASLSFDGAYYLDTTDLDLYFKIAGAWVIIASFAPTFPTNANNWEDLRFPASAIRVGGASPATEQAYRGGIVLSFASNIKQYAYMVAQLPHSRIDDSDLLCHIHWTTPVAGMGGAAENVKWDLTYSWADIFDTFPVQSSDSLTADVSSEPANPKGTGEPPSKIRRFGSRHRYMGWCCPRLQTRGTRSTTPALYGDEYPAWRRDVSRRNPVNNRNRMKVCQIIHRKTSEEAVAHGCG